MRREERIELLSGALKVFLAEPPDGAFLVIENPDRLDDFVQFIFHNGGVLYGEVGSHGWGEEPDQLSEGARAELLKLGFTGGGRRRNYINEGLPHDPEFLAELVEKAFS